MKSIKLGPNTYAHVFVHEIPISFEEAIIASENGYMPDFKGEANKYLEALEDNDCVAFLEELHKACAQRIVKHWEEFAPERLKEEYYKQYLKFKE